MQIRLPFMTLFCLISFASVNAVLFTPALPTIASDYALSMTEAQQTISYFLIAYTAGQLIYGPLANRFGRKPLLYMGIGLEILASFVCICAGMIHQYGLLLWGRFLLGFGSGVGLKMTFTLVNENYAPDLARQKTNFLMLAFAITPSLSVGLGSWLTSHLGWIACFYASAFYGLVLIFMSSNLKIKPVPLQLDAFNLEHLRRGYGSQFFNLNLVIGALIMGSTTSMVYIFAALAPFVVIKLYQMPTQYYGLFNLLTPIGLISGSLCSAIMTPKTSIKRMILLGVFFGMLGSLMMLHGLMREIPPLYSIFLPAIIVNFGLSLILGNASAFALKDAEDKAYGSAVMSFINMGLATIMVSSLAWMKIDFSLLGKCYLMMILFIFALSFRI
jgi:DHA1 family bicyclomycin/chloramphenicol resistance-like MFS transporter